MNEELISIIIPVYNAEKYLGKCLETVTKQTYENLEIILINDGSKDNSKNICVEWLEKDKRITYLEQENSGQGAARNRAIKLAKGEYLAFIDADDWVDKNYIIEMYKTLSVNNADMCRGNSYYIYDEKANTETLCQDPPRTEFIGEAPHLWMNLFRKALFLDNSIVMPNMPYEDLAVYPLLPLVSKKVCFIDKPLYYYRINTGISTMDNVKHLRYYPQALQYLIDEMKRLRLYDEYEPFVLETCVGHMRSGLKIAGEKIHQTEYDKLAAMFQSFLVENFKEWKNVSLKGKAWIWGSYNLTRIVANFKQFGLGYSLIGRDLPYYFGFSSIISGMAQKVEDEVPFHENIFRRNMLEKDFLKSFLGIQPGKDDCILVDFLEERYGVAGIENSYVTCSDALIESGYLISKTNCYFMEDDDWEDVWRKNCDMFINVLKDKFKAENVILIKTYLTTEKLLQSAEGIQIGKFYPKEKINKINECLHKCYQYFESKFGGIQIIDIPDEYYYTDGASKYGTGPEYLNFNAHKKMAKNIIELF